MTTDDRPPALRGSRRRTMQDDLLDDLRQATPVPVAPTAGERAPEDPVAPGGQPSLHLEVTLQRWSWPRLRVLPGGSGLSVGIGPVRVSCALRGR
ncbi:hypothetical protein [Geodermatophilus sp. SYSU D01176]